MFIIIFIKKKLCLKNEVKIIFNNKFRHLKYLLITIFDIISWNLSIIGIIFLSPLLRQILEGDIIIFTLIGSIIYLKNKYYKNHYLGSALLAIGLCFIGNNYISKSTYENPLIGLICLIISQILSSKVYILEEKLVKEYENSILKLMGLEGLWGLLCYAIVLLIFQYIRCDNLSSKNYVCFFSSEDNKHSSGIFEDSLFAFVQMRDNKVIFFFILFLIFAEVLFNYFRLTIYKYYSAVNEIIFEKFLEIIFLSIFIPILILN